MYSSFLEQRIDMNNLEKIKTFKNAYKQATGREPDMYSAHGSKIASMLKISPALTAKISMHPEWFDEIVSSAFWDRKKPELKIAEETESIYRACTGFTQEKQKAELCKYKYKELIRIASKTICSADNQKETLEEWSQITKSIIEIAHRLIQERLAKEFNISKKLISGSAVIALGKLGGMELNFSSDIDLLFIYRNPHRIDEEIFIKLAEYLTRFLSSPSQEGFLYRVDNELRPNGNSGRLANSINAVEQYYTYFAEDWEKQSLIKASHAAGSIETAEEFLSFSKKICFNSCLSTNDLQKLRKLKSKVEKSAGRFSTGLNLKHGKGGIREIEFTIQVLQRTHGGRIPEIRKHNTFEAITSLEKFGIMQSDIADSLIKAYSFLRRLENILQLYNDLQTHTMPQHIDRIIEICSAINTTKDNLYRELNRHMSFAASVFDSILAPNYEFEELNAMSKANMASCLNTEEKIDAIAWFKHRNINSITSKIKFTADGISQAERKATALAEISIQRALEIALEAQSRQKLAYPLRKDGRPAGFAIIGLGSLGSQEMDCRSDLDICFIYDSGGIFNKNHSHFFTKLAQKIIQILSLPTRYGKAYEIDSELRPSGNQGALVTSLDNFLKYHKTRAAIWEHISMLKARLISNCGCFSYDINEEILNIAYSPPFSPHEDVKKEIMKIRASRLNSIMHHKNTLDIKFGAGGIFDIDIIFRTIQLLNCVRMPELKTQNIYDLAKAIKKRNLLKANIVEQLIGSLVFFKSILWIVRQSMGNKITHIKKTGQYTKLCAHLLKIDSQEKLFYKLASNMQTTNAIFENIINSI